MHECACTFESVRARAWVRACALGCFVYYFFLVGIHVDDFNTFGLRITVFRRQLASLARIDLNTIECASLTTIMCSKFAETDSLKISMSLRRTKAMSSISTL